MKSPVRWSLQDLVYLTIAMFTFFCTEINSSAVQLQAHNIDSILRSNELVFVNFYADWCRFSQMLQPIFDETAKKVQAEFPESGRVVLGKVDCDKEGGIAAQYHVSKYPTLKIFRYGTLVKREYRGQRSADSLATFIRDALKDPIKRVNTLEELENLDRKKRHIIGYFDTEDSQHFINYRKLSSMLRDECEFHAAVGHVSANERATGNKIVYRPPNPDETDIPFTGDLHQFDLLHTWAMDKCVPLVREITFENAEELTEEGLPFLILFHHPDDSDTPDKFRKVVASELLPEKNGVNFLTADGQKFSHPLYHLGKSTSDLPVLAIDSFRHMYLWKKDPKENLESGAALKEFISDLHSGKLHREFHHGPDPTTPQPGEGDGNSDTALALPEEEKKEAHVQQQIILSSNGMTVQVVRVVEIGNPRELNLQDQLHQLHHQLFGGGHDNDGDAGGAEEHDSKNEEDQEEDGEEKDPEKIAAGELLTKQKQEEENVQNKMAEELGWPSAKNDLVDDMEKIVVSLDSEEGGDHKIVQEKVIPITLSSERETRENDVQVPDQGQEIPSPHNRQMDPRQGHHVPTNRQDPNTDPRQARRPQNPKRKKRSPPSSIFRHLTPSRDRYTVLHDEF